MGFDHWWDLFTQHVYVFMTYRSDQKHIRKKNWTYYRENWFKAAAPSLGEPPPAGVGQDKNESL